MVSKEILMKHGKNVGKNVRKKLYVSPAHTDSSISATNSATHQYKVNWSKQYFNKTENDFKFKGDSSLPEDILSLKTPYEFFSYFFTEELITKIVKETCIFHYQKNSNQPFELSTNEMNRFLGICIYMSHTVLLNVRKYWATRTAIPTVQNAMSVNKFEKIRQFLHFNDNNKAKPLSHPKHDRLHKIRPIIEYLQTRFQLVPYEEKLSIDEQMCATKVRHFLKQYMPLKPHKWGYKLFVICSTSGYAYKFEIYSGQENLASRLPNELDLGSSANVVVRLCRDIPKYKNHKVYYDNYYTSLPLQVYLAEQGILSVGTVRRNRIPGVNVLSEDELKKKPRGTYDESVCKINSVDVAMVTWKDNKVVNLMSTFVGSQPVESISRFTKKTKTREGIACPKIVKAYNQHMGGVDLMDSHFGRHKIAIKSKKWYFRLFYHLVDMAVINAWIVQKKVLTIKNMKKEIVTLGDFREILSETLCKMGINETMPKKRGRPSNIFETSFKKQSPNSNIPPSEIIFDKTDHWQLWDTNRRTCKVKNCKKLSYTKCTKCNVHLCYSKKNDCFRRFHNPVFQ